MLIGNRDMDEEVLDDLDQTRELEHHLPVGIGAYSPEGSLLGGMYRTWFLDYASYVILERAVPHIDDGLKPVQRRILHNMKVLDNGKLIKVQNIAGTTMKYHPHGDASINDAIVQLGQKGYLIDTQGNWGNILTGDQAAAGRYIEAKLSAFALEALFGDQITEWKKTYDGTLDEPIALPVRFPLLLAQGAEGIAVGLSSKILPHNFVELCQASIAYLKGEQFSLYPDFQTGGLIDVSRYNDGERGGTLKSRAKIEKIDNRTLSITELPAGKTTTSLIDSILKAVEKNKIRIKRVDDMTAATTDIRIHLAPGVSSDKSIDALYAFTDCELSISPNCCVIHDEKPLFTSVSEVLRYSVDRTKSLFDKDLRIRLKEKEEQYLGASLERIFIEERIYKDKEFEEAWSEAEALAHVDSRLMSFKEQFIRPICSEDVKKLLDIRMARILRFNLPKHEEQIKQIQSEIEQLKHDIAHINAYTIRWFEHLITRYGDRYPRRTKIINFSTIEVVKVVELDCKLYINRKDGFIGTAIKDGDFVCNCSSLDDILVIFRSGKYQIMRVEDKRFIGSEEVIYLGRYLKNDDRTIYNVVYRDGVTSSSYIKRCLLSSLIRDKVYDLTRGSEKSKVLYLTVNSNGEAEKILIKLKMQNRKQRLFEFERDFSDIPIKGKSSVGLLVTKADISSIRLLSKGISTLGGRPVWFDRDVLRLNYTGQGEYLGEFDAQDLILIFGKNGDYYTTDFSDSNHFDSNLMKLEKYDASKVWTAVYWDAKLKHTYLKRFTVEPTQKLTSIILDTSNELLLLTDSTAPRISVPKDKSDNQSNHTIIDCEEFTEIKGAKLKGKRLLPFKPEYLEEVLPFSSQGATDNNLLPINNLSNASEDQDHSPGTESLFSDK